MRRAPVIAVLAGMAALTCARGTTAATPGTLCEISGSAGSVATCAVRVARSSENTAAAHALQLQLKYPTALTLSHFSTCASGCPAYQPPAGSWDGPQVLFVAPPAVGSWAGEGTLVLLDPQGNQNPLSTAWMNGPAVVGNDEVVWLHFVLSATIPGSAPAVVVPTGVSASNDSGKPLPTSVLAGRIIVGDVSTCPINGIACDDGDSCTVGDTCVAGSCVGSAVQCDDANFCNGIAHCVAGQGCVPGIPSVCDDNNACTVESCHAAEGCRITSTTPCDDGIACTADSCHPTFGCTYVPNNSLCEDGEPCTANECVQGTGCSTTPLFCFDPTSPPNQLCDLSGPPGSQVACGIHLVREALAAQKPVSLQLGLNYGSALTLIGFRACPTCSVIPSVSMLPTGHSVILSPSSPNDWAGAGTLALLHLSAADTAITHAWLDGVSVVGDSLALEAVFLVGAAASGDTSPGAVWVGTASSGAEGAVPLQAKVQSGRVVVSSYSTSCSGPGTPCNDGNACTQNDNCVASVCVGTPVTCSDGNYCNGIETCSPSMGCLPGPSPQCEDGEPCTSEGCNPVTGCFAAGPTVCDDGDACTLDTCVLGIGCTFAGPAILCDDGEPCTIDSCTPDLGCLHQPTACYQPGAPADSICEVSGSAGAEFDCVVRLARRSQQQASANSAQVDFLFPSSVEVLSVRECVGCATIPPATSLSTGHTAFLAPVNPAMWGETGSLILLDFSAGSVPLTTGYLAAGIPNGDVELVVLRIRRTAASNAPAHVRVTGAVASGAGGVPVSVSVENGVLVTDAYQVACANAGAPCNDGNACTLNDTCVGGFCVGTPVSCDDGNLCNGLEKCLPDSGCVAGPAADCGDGDACTVDICTLAGCSVGGFTDCDDADPCTTDSCNSNLGCINVANVSCDDGDVCTQDSCVAGQGCAYAPLACAPAPLPPNALCAISGPAGATVDCLIRVARGGNAQAPAVSAQLTLQWGAGVVLEGFAPCDGCAELIPPHPQASTGHHVFPSPATVDGWGNGGTLLALHLGAPETPLTSAWMHSGSVQGNATFVVAKLTLSSSIDAATPAFVSLGSASLAKTGAIPLGWTVQNGVIVTEALPGCEVEGAPCDDNSACTANDGCISGVCVGTPVVCNDGDYCNGVEVCTPADGCSPGAAPNCDDGNACTLDTCHPQWGCSSAAQVVCDDSNPCTVDSCDTALGCQYVVPAGTCDDGDSCTQDTCDAVLGCVSQALECYNPITANAACVLTGPAGGVVRCALRVARASQMGASPVALNFAISVSGPGDVSKLVACEACSDSVPPNLLSGGQLVFTNPPDPQQFAQQGLVAILPSPSAGEVPLSTAYMDGLGVVGDDVFMAVDITLSASATLSNPLVVHIQNPVASGAGALPLSATVQHGRIVVGEYDVPCAVSGLPCDDGDLCTTGDTCVGGLCVGQPLICDDGVFCNGFEVCDSNSGQCANGPAPSCDDANVCTTGQCTESGCAQAAVVCDDGNACTTDVCDSVLGCGFAPVVCDDGDSCTADSCNPISGCEHAPQACFELSDGVLCRVSGAAGATVDCSLRIARTSTSPESAASLQFTLLYDPNWLQLVAFQPAGGGPNIPPHPTLTSGHNLFAAEPALWNGSVSVVILHVAAPDTALSNGVWNGTSFSGSPEFAIARFTLNQNIATNQPIPVLGGGIAVTGPGALFLGAQVLEETIVVGPAPECEVLGAPCDDTNACTENDVCLPGGCVGTPAVCGDGDFCTGLDSCNPITGCTSGPPPDCSDGDACTTNICHPLFGCLPAAGVVCDDNNPCTADSCDSVLGCTSTNINVLCDDGLACTEGGVCIAGTCVSLGGQANCDDGNVCTVDTCEPVLGCVHTSVACDDGIPCTTDFCNPVFGCSVAPNSALCSDGNPCTVDFCNPLVGCVYGNLTVACDDGNACTVGDQCFGGQCVGGQDPMLGSACDGDDADFCEDGEIRCEDEELGIGCVNTGPALLYEFDGNITSYAADVSGGGHDGALIADANILAGGIFGGALRTFGTAGRVASDYVLPQRNFTIALWFRTGAANGTLLTAAAGGDLAQGGADRTLFIRGGRLGFALQTSGGLVECVSTSPAVNTNTWRHAAVACRALQGCTLYHNGTPICSTGPSAAVSVLVAEQTLLGYSPANGFYNGFQDRVAAFDYSMNQAELTDFLANGPTDPLTGLNLELCDGVDNDCDGVIDNGCACLFAGDLNGDGNTDVVDAQCAVLTSLSQLANTPAPGCLGGPVTVADLNCDGAVNVVDVQILIRIALKLPLAPDVNQNQCIDTCEPDLN